MRNRFARLSDVDVQLAKTESELHRILKVYRQTTPRVPETSHRFVVQQYIEEAIDKIVKARASAAKAAKWINGVPKEFRNEAKDNKND